MEKIDWSNPQDFIIGNYTLKLTCGACPEQYDVFNKSDKQVGYLRLRHGSFSASYPECGGKQVYHACPVGDGIFEDDEREFYLTEAIKAIQAEDEQTAIDMLTERE